METKKLHYLIASISYIVIIIHFILSHYTTEECKSGILFFSLSTIIYVGFVYLFFKSDLGKFIVVGGLIFIAIISIFLIFTTV
ncbi:hypothetical protein SAMN04487943_102123 [Gracilibacillus orientalis]|uniref:Uncharacterized protein n=1 Tax=Gracilibacillus orientalis TaxID=334253 RepID=A0A1I4IJ95_9BACI|nr:hypothetical protein SAMN04487943_102123 [Gracilibacillus orientalis]